MREPADYLAAIELALLKSPILATYHVLQRSVTSSTGYIRFRATLSNGDQLEAAEYFAVCGDQVATVRYQHQWMDAQWSALRIRWDCSPHYPGLPGFPHHRHVGEEANVQPGVPMSIAEVLAYITERLDQS